MKAHDGFGFMGFGLLMTFLPAFLPASFPANGVDGSSASALWLELMGGVNALVGGGFLVRKVPVVVARLAAWAISVRLRPTPLPVYVLRPALPSPVSGLYPGLTPKVERRLAA